jgi:hypothetical protein
LGNHNGLLILSKTGRNWYPTQHPAQKNSVSIKFTVENQIHRLDFSSVRKQKSMVSDEKRNRFV